MKIESVFFSKEGEKGLNETSAAHLCALADQIKATDEMFIRHISLINKYIQIIGSTAKPHQAQIGYTSEQLKELSTKLQRIGRMNSFISWFSEARKTLEGLKREAQNLDFNDYVKETGIEVPEKPSRQEEIDCPTLQDVIDDMNVKDRQTYLELEARAAALGKTIHPDGSFEKARSKMHEVERKPFETNGLGRETVITEYRPSVSSEEVDELYNTLEKEYRKVQQSLNHMKSDLRKELDARKLAHKQNNERKAYEFRKAMEAYDAEMDILINKYAMWQDEINTQLSKVKFCIPKALESVVIELNNA